MSQVSGNTGLYKGNNKLFYLLRNAGAGGSGSGDMTKSQYDTDDDGIVDDSELLDGQPATDFEEVANKNDADGYAGLNSDYNIQIYDTTGTVESLIESRDTTPQLRRFLVDRTYDIADNQDVLDLQTDVTNTIANTEVFSFFMS